MGMRRLVLCVVGLLLLASCETIERIEIRADGSATLTETVIVARNEAFLEWYQLDFAEWTALALSDRRRFLRETFELRDADPVLDELGVIVVEDEATFTREREAASIDELVELLAEDRLFPALAGTTITESRGNLVLEANAVESLRLFWTAVLEVEAGFDVFAEGVEDVEKAFVWKAVVELKLPGAIISHDAHDRDGNTLRWSWTIGESARPGITATWDPLGEPETNFDWWGLEQLVIYGLILFGMVILVIAGSRGLLGFTSKLEKEGERVAGGRWPSRDGDPPPTADHGRRSRSSTQSELG